MSRVGHNPMKAVSGKRATPRVTVVTTVYIPEERGFWEHSLDVLRIVFGSLGAHTTGEYDLWVLDNGSCQRVKDYLLSLQTQGFISLLLLSSENIGKTGALNVLLGASQSELVAYMDSDIAFRPQWLERSIAIVDAFPRVGMVTARPARTMRARRDLLLSSTIRFAETQPSRKVVRGDLVPHRTIQEFAASVGQSFDEYMRVRDPQDLLMEQKGVSAFAYAGHYQFVIPSSLARQVVPLPVEKLVGGGDAELDVRINRLNCLRLSTTEPLVCHLGNTLSAQDLREFGHFLEVTPKREAVAGGRGGVALGALRKLARFGRVRKLLSRGQVFLLEALHR